MECLINDWSKIYVSIFYPITGRSQSNGPSSSLLNWLKFSSVFSWLEFLVSDIFWRLKNEISTTNSTTKQVTTHSRSEKSNPLLFSSVDLEIIWKISSISMFWLNITILLFFSVNSCDLVLMNVTCNKRTRNDTEICEYSHIFARFTNFFFVDEQAS